MMDSIGFISSQLFVCVLFGLNFEQGATTSVELSGDVLTTDGHQERTVRFDEDFTIRRDMNRTYGHDRKIYDGDRKRQMYYYVES